MGKKKSEMEDLNNNLDVLLLSQPLYLEVKIYHLCFLFLVGSSTSETMKYNSGACTDNIIHLAVMVAS